MFRETGQPDINMTVEKERIRPLHTQKGDSALFPLKVIAFTHKSTPLKELNRFFLHEENRRERLNYLRLTTDISEILYIATCNRIEFVFCTEHPCDQQYLQRFFRNFRQDWNDEEIEFALRHGHVYEGEAALDHLLRVASSLDSLVVGEREIITQVRKSYDTCHADGLTGDLLRLVVKHTITTAKQVYTDTKIAANPVSIVSLAERKLRALHLPLNSRILIIGSGETNTNLCKYLAKQGHTRFILFNRTRENAEKLAQILVTEQVHAEAHALKELPLYRGGFDVLISCTGSAHAVVTPEIYEGLLNGETGKKVVVDLAVPADIHPLVSSRPDIHLIDISELKSIAEKNLVERQGEFRHAERIIDENILLFHELFRTRMLELKMKEVPHKVREIRDRAMKNVFAKDLESLDTHSREVLDKVIDYLENKYISVPMIMAKEILLDKR